jgi:hypothetical protein
MVISGGDPAILVSRPTRPGKIFSGAVDKYPLAG